MKIILDKFRLISVFIFLWMFLLSKANAQDYVDNQIVIQFDDYALFSEILTLQEELNAVPLNYYSSLNGQLWQIPNTVQLDDGTILNSVEEVQTYCAAKGFIQEAEPNFEYELFVNPNDPQYNQCWGLNNTGQTGGTADADIDAPEAWNIRTDGSGKVVGVTDTGIDYDHPDLQSNMWINVGETPGNGVDDDGNGYIDDYHGYDFINGDGDPMDGHGHGTHVAGTIGAVGNSALGVSGVAWTAKLAALQIFDANGSTNLAAIIEAIEYSIMMNIPITNNSWGGPSYSAIMHNTIQDAQINGQLFIAAAGNYSINNDMTPFYPASYNLDNIISVAATDHNDNIAGFSHYGLTSVDLGAPGVSVYSTEIGNSYGYKSGTSMASPHVAGAAALVWSANPSMSFLDVKERILCNVDNITALNGKCVSEGRLNVHKALQNPGPDATFTYTTNGLTVNFSANNTNSNVTSYEWYFGDNNTVITTANTTHTYASGGTYTVCLCVIDDCGYDTYCEPITLVNGGSGIGCGIALPTIEWQRTFGGSGFDFTVGIEQTNSGGYIVAGWGYSTDGNIVNNTGTEGFWVINFDSAGNVLWKKSYGGTGFDGATCIEKTTDGGYILGGWAGSNDGDVTGTPYGAPDYWILKLDNGGNIQWDKRFGGSNNDYVQDIKQTIDGGYIVAGETRSNNGDITNNHGDWDYWVLKLDSSGNLQWQKNYGGSSEERMYYVITTTDGGYMLTGRTESNDIDVLGHNGLQDGWILKLDNLGNIQWQRTLGGSGNDIIYSVQETFDGGYIITGRSGSTDGDLIGESSGFWVAKLNNSGNTEWQKTFANGGLGYSVKQIASGEYLILGTSGGATVSDMLLLKLDNVGQVIWQKILGGSDRDGGREVEQTNDGGYIIAGYSQSNDGDLTINYGEDDWWIVKLSPEGMSSSPPTFTIPSATCASTSLTFTNTSTGTTVFTWEVNGTYVANTNDLTYTFPTAGTYVVTLNAHYDLDGDGVEECTETTSQSVVVGSNATTLNLGPDIIECNNTSVTLDAGSTDMLIYAWDYNGALVGSTPTITVTQSGSYTLAVWDPCNNTGYDEINVTFATPTAVNLGPDIITCNPSITLDAGAGYSSYLWSTGATTQTITVTSTNTYSVTVTDANGCTDTDDIVVNFTTPPVVNLGPDILSCNTSAVLDAVITGAGMTYLWNTGATTQTITVTSSGTYSITVTDANGCTATDQIDVYLDNDCVWPGDANYDDVVNNVDILSIGAGNGTTDIVRPNATINWQAEPCPDWANNFTSGINYKHADCDGNGTINIADTLAVRLNYGQTHNGNAPRISSPVSNIELRPVFNNCSNVLNSQDYTITVGVHLEDIVNTTTVIHGVAFTLDYSNNLIASITPKFNNTWLDDDGASLLTFVKDFPVQQKMEIAISRLNQLDIIGVGPIAEFDVVVDAVPASNPQTLTFSTNTVVGMLGDGTDVAINGQSSNDAVPFSTAFDLNINLLSCDGTVTLDAGITESGMTYLWSTGETTKVITVSGSAIYDLTVTNAIGCTATDQIDVYLDDDCVWPGDTNYDDVVNNEDIHPMGFVYGVTGPTRPNATTNWQAEPSPDWGNCLSAFPAFATLECKHLDTNGDGIIDINDTNAVLLSNYGETHNGNSLKVPNSSIILRPEVVTYPSAANGNLLEVDLYVEENSGVVDMYGITFSINYTIEFTNAQVDFSNSWLGTKNVDMLTIAKDFPTQGIMDIGMVRIDLNNATAMGAIARFSATAVNTTSTTVNITTTNGLAIDNTASEEYLTDETSDPIPLFANPPTVIRAKALLEGAYIANNSSMHTNLNASGLLPTNQPFNIAPWNYTGTETVTNIPANVVDWVLLEVRDANNNYNIIERKAALLLNNGDVVDVNGITNGVNFFALIPNNDYYITLRHRNHLAVMSANAVTLPNTIVHDFTNPNNVMSGTSQLAQVDNGIYALVTGDFDSNGVINLRDYNFYQENIAQTSIYEDCDANLDGIISTQDFNNYQPNASRIGIRQLRY